jgi:hypothetical protein
LYCFWRHAPLSWIILPTLGIISVMLPSLGILLWQNSESLTVGVLMGAIIVLLLSGYCLLIVCATLGTIVWIGCAAVFGCLLRFWAADHRFISLCIQAAWHEAETGEAFVAFGKAAAWVTGMLGFGWLLHLLASIASDTDRFWIRFPYLPSLANAALTFTIIIWALITVIILVFSIHPSFTRTGLKSLSVVSGIAGGIVAYILLITGLTSAEWKISNLLAEWSLSRSVTRAVVIAVVIAVIFAFVAALAIAGRQVMVWCRFKLQQFRGMRIDPVRWADEVREAAPDEQALLLQFATPDQLGVDVARLLALLSDLEKHIGADPARSVYHARIAELLDLRRQERAG